jgi:hypothetical protein
VERETAVQVKGVLVRVALVMVGKERVVQVREVEVGMVVVVWMGAEREQQAGWGAQVVVKAALDLVVGKVEVREVQGVKVEDL